MGDEPWHLDKRVPVAIIFALAVQTAGAVWWASAITRDVERLRETDARLEAADVQIRLDAQARETRLRIIEQAASRTETKLESIEEGVNRLNTQMDRLLQVRQ